MTDTQRRALLVTLATTQAALAIPTLALAAPADAATLQALQRAADSSGDALLERAATFDPDPGFRAVCARALTARRAAAEAWARYWSAHDAAEAAAPFPESLMVSCRHFAADLSETRRWRERWTPASDAQGWALDTLAARRVRKAGGTLQQARADLRAEFDAWSASLAAEHAARGAPALLAAANAATDAEGAARAAFDAYPPLGREAFLTKLLLLYADGAPVNESSLRAIVADALSALAS